MRPKEVVEKWYLDNDGSRTLLEAVVLVEVAEALKDWVAAVPGSVLIGSLAVSHYTRPRTAQTIDVLLASEQLIPWKVAGFERVGDHLFRHSKTCTDVSVYSPERLPAVPPQVISTVIATATVSDGCLVASRAGLVALKLFRGSYQDLNDIIILMKSGEVDVEVFELAAPQLELYRSLRAEAEMAVTSRD